MQTGARGMGNRELPSRTQERLRRAQRRTARLTYRTPCDIMIPVKKHFTLTEPGQPMFVARSTSFPFLSRKDTARLVRKTAACCSAVLLLLASSHTLGDVVTFEGVDFPEIEDDSWEHLPFCAPVRWVQDGVLIQELDFDCNPPPHGDWDAYSRSLADFVGEEEFFIEFRMQTDGDQSEIPYVSPAALATGGFSIVAYHFTISRDLVRFGRDNFQETVYVEIEPGSFHTYRVELHGADQYFIYIDGESINSGVPGGPFPDHEKNVIAWLGSASYLPNITRWDYVRFGTTPQNSSGDFNTDFEIDSYDLYYFHECLTTEAGGWPGCVWADMGFSGGVNCDDWALFLAAWTDPADPPAMPECDCAPPDLDCNGSVSAFDLALLLGSWGPCSAPPADCPADLDADGSVGAADLAFLLGSWG